MNSFDINLQKRLLKTLNEKNIEFEILFHGVQFNSKKKNNNNLQTFLNLIKRCKAFDYQLVENGIETLDIFINSNNNPLRVTIDKNEIIKFCKLNKLSEQNINNILLKKKIKQNGFESLLNDEYNFTVNIKQEIDFSKINIETNINSKDYKNQFFNEYFPMLSKRFRLKKRYSFVTNDQLFRIDLTIVRQATGKNIVESNLFTKPKIYEIELEYIGPRFTKNKSDTEKKDIVITVIKQLKINIGYISQVIQDSFYIISKTERNIVYNTYNSLLQTIYKKRKRNKIGILTNFIKYVQNTTLDKLFNQDTIQHYFKNKKIPYYLKELYDNLININNKNKLSKQVILTKLNSILQYIEQYNIQPSNRTLSIGFKPSTLIMNNLHHEENISILDNYTVTDKAEGEGKILYIFGHNHINELESNPNKQQIMDCLGKIYMIDHKSIIFTGMITNNTAYTNCIFNGEFMKFNKTNQYINRYLAYDLYYCNKRDYHEMPLLTKDGVCRIKKLNNIINKLNKNEQKIHFSIALKQFYMGSNIFTLSNKIIENVTIDYKLDGLIYTPAYSPVGYDKIDNNNSIDNLIINNYDLQYGKTWFSNLKWKDSKDNSIDFKIKFVQNDNGKDIIVRDDNNKRYKIIHLYCGKFNKKTRKYEEVLFIPTSPYDENAYKVNVFIDDTDTVLGVWDNFPIEHNQVIEFTYELSTKKWIPLRTRFDKIGTFGNDYFTSNAIWKNMHMPITINMITTGKNIMEREYYYFKNDEFAIRTKSNIIALRNYHNKIKDVKLTEVVSMIRKDNSNKEIRLLEIACGKAQDIHKWKKNNIEYIIGIDKIRDNIENPYNGANARFLELTNKWTNNIHFLVGDCSRNIKNLDAFSLEFYRELASTQITSTYNLISIQFAIHYFFNNIESIQNIIRNIDENLENNGYFIGCCFDGSKIIKLLKDIPYKGTMKTKLWEIYKLFNPTDTTNEDDDLLYVPYKINVYIDSIGQNNIEYLVNFSYFIKLLEDKNIILISLDSFEELGKQSILKSFYDKMNQDEQTLSNLNSYFIFQKQHMHNEEESDDILDDIDESEVITEQTDTTNILKQKIRSCMNLCYNIFEKYKLYLVGARVSTKNKSISTSSTTKTTKSKKMYVWDDFKQYLDSIDNIQKCIEDIKQYKNNQKQYDLLEYDFNLIDQYELYLDQIKNIMKNKNTFITKDIRKQNKELIKYQNTELLSKLLIECFEDFTQNNYNYENITQSKFYIASTILTNINVLFTKAIKIQLKSKQIDLTNIITSYQQFIKLNSMHKLIQRITNPTNSPDENYIIVMKQLETIFSNYTTQLSKMSLIETDAYKHRLFIQQLINYITKINNKIIPLQDDTLVNQNLIHYYQKLFTEINNNKFN